MGNTIGYWKGNRRYLTETLDGADWAIVSRSFNTIMEHNPSGTPGQWSGGRARGSFTPGPAYRSMEGRDCRPFTAWVTIGGQEQPPEGGVACRTPNGEWTVRYR
jgi:surface antigen